MIDIHDHIPSRSLTQPLKSQLPNRKAVFQPPFVRGYVKLPGGIIRALIHGLFLNEAIQSGIFFCRFITTKKKGLERNGMRSWDFILPVIYGVSCHGNLGNFLRPYLFPPVGHGFPQKVVVFGESGPQNGERNIQVKD